MRYVVRNNFFGLESRPQNQKGIQDKVTPAIPTGEHKGRQEKPSEEARAVPRSTSLVGGERSSVKVSYQEDLEKSKAVDNQYLHTCSESSKDPPVEQDAGYFIQNTEETTTKDCHNPYLTGTDQIRSTSYISDDEIWESPGAVMS